ncbi:MAG: hypothetical protein ACE3JN_04000 [Ectobacillus sp.]
MKELQKETVAVKVSMNSRSKGLNLFAQLMNILSLQEGEDKGASSSLISLTIVVTLVFLIPIVLQRFRINLLPIIVAEMNSLACFPLPIPPAFC